MSRPADGGHDLAGAATSGRRHAARRLHRRLRARPRLGLDPLRSALRRARGGAARRFVLVERRVAHPLIRLGILRVGSIVRANLSIVALFGSYLSFQFMMTLPAGRLGWSPLKMAMALLPAGLHRRVRSPFVGRLVDRYGTAADHRRRDWLR